MVNQVSTLKHHARMLAECELFGTPEQYKEQAAQLRKTYGKVILRTIIKDSQIVVGSYQANMARAFGKPTDRIMRRNKTYRNYLNTLGQTANQMEDNGYDEEF